MLILTQLPDSYVEEIRRERAETDRVFADPQRSPLATVGITLLDRPVTVIGTAPDADFRWERGGLSPHHLKVMCDGDTVRLEALDGKVKTVPGGEPVTTSRWQMNQLFQVGSVLMILQQHPVGPVLRVIDPEAPTVKEFSGLKYFPVSSAYRVRAVILPGVQKKVTIVDTQGWTRPAYIYGKASFMLGGQTNELDLLLFEEHPAEGSRFMVIFQDGTTGRESYPACRYLYIPFQSSGETDIDFNRASNPSCAYGAGFACPLPLPGNRLAVRIEAGEKRYFEGKH